jgi:TRAP transporter TAXI family solute receptor
VSLGPPGGSGALTAELVLTAHGVDLSELKTERLAIGDAARKIITGELDAVFVYGYPVADIAEAVRHGARIVEIVGTDIDQFRVGFPLLRPTVLPGGTYPPIDQPIHTVGINGIYICRNELDEDIVHELTRAFVALVSRRDLNIEPLRGMDLGSASSTAIPLHPGAARYYRERELLP